MKLNECSFLAGFHLQTLTTLFEQVIEINIPFIITAKNNQTNVQVKIRYF